MSTLTTAPCPRCGAECVEALVHGGDTVLLDRSAPTYAIAPGKHVVGGEFEEVTFAWKSSLRALVVHEVVCPERTTPLLAAPRRPERKLVEVGR